MADDTTAPAPDPTTYDPALINQMIQQMLQPAALPQQSQAPVPRSTASLLGEAFGGGSQYGSPAERETAGTRALLSLGVGMLGASGYSPVRRTLGEVVAQGIGGAQESLARSGSVAAAQLAAQQDYAQKQQEMQLSRIKEALPLLTLQQQLASAAAARKLAGGGGGPANTSIAAVGGDTYEGAIGGHEGLGADPRLPSTVGGFIPSTWQGFVAANPDLFKGMTAEQQMAARSDPKLNAAGISWLAQQNADQLTKAGVTPSGPALGIAHYLGAGAAAKVLQAPDNALVAGFVSDAAVKANPELAKMTVAQLKQRYANVPAPAFLGGPKPGAAPAPAVTAQTPPAVSTAPPSAQAVPPIPPAPPSAVPSQTAAFVPGGNLPYGAPGPAPTAPGAPLVPPAAPAPRTSTTLRGTGTPATPQLPGGNQQLSQGEPVPAPYQIAGAVTGPPSSSFGIIGQAARAAEEGGPPPSPPPPVTAQPQFPDVVQGDVVTRHPGTFQDFAKREMEPTPATEDFNPNLSPAQQAAFAAKARDLQLKGQQLGTLPPQEQAKAGMELTAARAALEADQQNAIAAKSQAAAAAKTKFDDAQRAAVQTRYQTAVSAYNDAAKGKAGFNQDIVKSQSEKRDAANQKILEPYATGAAQAQGILPLTDLAKQVLPGLPQNAAPWLADEKNRAQLAPFERFMPTNWREAVQSADTFQQVMGGMVSQMGANVVSGQPGGRESAYEQFKTMLPVLSQSAEGRERALMFIEELGKRRIAENEFMQNYAMDPKNRDPELKVANLSGAASAMNAALGPMVRLPPSRYDPNVPISSAKGQAMAHTYADYFTKLPDNARYVTYSQGEDGKYHPAVRVKAPGQTRPEAVTE